MSELVRTVEPRMHDLALSVVDGDLTTTTTGYVLRDDATTRGVLYAAARVRVAIVLRALREWRPLDAVELVSMSDPGVSELVSHPLPLTARARLCQVPPQVVVRELKRELHAKEWTPEARARLTAELSQAGLALSAQVSAAVFAACFADVALPAHAELTGGGESGAIGDLLAGRIESEDSARRRAASAGYVLGKAHVAAVVGVGSDNEAETELTRHLKGAAQAIVATTSDQHGEQVALVLTRTIAVVVRTDDGCTAFEVGRKIHEAVRAHVPASLCPSAGIGQSRVGALGIADSWRQANDAREVAAAVGGETLSMTYEEAVPYLLLRSAPRLGFDAYLATIEPLVKADAQRSTQLVRTIDAYLSTGGNMVETSRRVYAHRQTLYARIHRIEELTGRSLDEPSDRLLFALGMCFSRMVGDTHVPPPPPPR